MGTPAIVTIRDEEDDVICCLYTTYDGNLLAGRLRDYLSNKKIVNGIGPNETWDDSFNGMGCLAASVVAYFKDDIGIFYLVSPNSDPEANYIIDIWLDDDGVIRVEEAVIE